MPAGIIRWMNSAACPSDQFSVASYLWNPAVWTGGVRWWLDWQDILPIYYTETTL